MVLNDSTNKTTPALVSTSSMSPASSVSPASSASSANPASPASPISGAASGAISGFARDTKVLMYDGSFKKAEDIKVGDEVMGIDSKPRKVLSVRQGQTDMYRVKTYNNLQFVCAAKTKLVLVYKNSDRLVPLVAERYKQKTANWKRSHHLMGAAIEFPDREVPLEPYFVGLWLMRGVCVGKDIVFYVKFDELFFSNYLFKFAYRYNLPCSQSGRITKAAGNQGFEIRFPNRQINSQKLNLYEELEKLGITDNKFIPSVYFVNSKEKRLKLLAGILDSHGRVSQERLLFIRKRNKRLIDDIANLALLLGIRTSRKTVSEPIKLVAEGTSYVAYERVYFGPGVVHIPMLNKFKFLGFLNKANLQILRKKFLKEGVELSVIKTKRATLAVSAVIENLLSKESLNSLELISSMDAAKIAQRAARAEMAARLQEISKFDVIKDTLRYQFRIESISVDDCYEFKLDGDGCFVLSNSIAVLS